MLKTTKAKPIKLKSWIPALGLFLPERAVMMKKCCSIGNAIHLSSRETVSANLISRECCY